MDSNTEKIFVKDRVIIGDNSEPYFIAEIGTNHNGDIETAKKLISEAAKSGFNCVKFQIYEPHEIVSPSIRSSEYKLEKLYGDISAFDMFDKYLKTPKDWFPNLIEYSKKLTIDTCVTLHGEESINWAKSLDFDLIKIASMDHNNIPLFDYLLKNIKKPILISFGLAYEEDIEMSIKKLKCHQYGIGIFHCVSIYPPNQSELRLSNIKYLRNKYNVEVGFSDHALGSDAALTALTLGATFFEKHITLDNKSKGPDHAFALMPIQMKTYTKNIKDFYMQINNNKFIKPSGRETDNRNAYMKSAIATRDINKGESLQEQMIYFARPGFGIPPNEISKILGKTVNRFIGSGQLINKEFLEM